MSRKYFEFIQREVFYRKRLCIREMCIRGGVNMVNTVRVESLKMNITWQCCVHVLKVLWNVSTADQDNLIFHIAQITLPSSTNCDWVCTYDFFPTATQPHKTLTRPLTTSTRQPLQHLLYYPDLYTIPCTISTRPTRPLLDIDPTSPTWSYRCRQLVVYGYFVCI